MSAGRQMEGGVDGGKKKTKHKTQEDEKGLYLAGADSSSLIGLDCEQRLYEHE